MKNKESSVDFIEFDEMKRMITERANSGEWYIIPCFSRKEMDSINTIEQTFFMKGNNDKFEVFIGSWGDCGFGSFAFAKKSEIPSGGLRQISDGVVAKTDEELNEITVIMSTNTTKQVFNFLQECMDGK